MLGVSKHGDDEAFPASDRDPDVVVVLVDDLLAADLRVHLRELHQGVDRGLHEERHESKLHAEALLERLAKLLAQGDDLRHVDLVECREKRGGVLRLLEPLGDPKAHRAHRHRFLDALGVRGPGHGRRRDAARRPGSAGRGPGRAARQAVEHVLLENAPTRPAGRNVRHAQIVLGKRAARGGHDAGLGGARRRGRRRSGRRRGGAGSGRRCGGGRCGGRGGR